MHRIDKNLFEAEEGLFLITISKDKKTMPRINHMAVRQYNEYFSKVLNQFVFEIKLITNQIYYTFSHKDLDTWANEVYGQNTVQATKYLDRVQYVQLNSSLIQNARDCTETVKRQYQEQFNVIFNSYQLVERIVKYPDNPMVQKAIKIVEDSRADDDSKRKYWRALNEKYYGLDIHPLMEYEIGELQNLMYYCEHPEEMPLKNYHPVLLIVTLLPVGIVAGAVATKLILG